MFIDFAILTQFGQDMQGGSRGGKRLRINRMVEAAGVEPDPGRSTKRLMAHDFRRKTLIPRRFSPSIESPGVPYSPLESTPVVETFWRRIRFAVPEE